MLVMLSTLRRVGRISATATKSGRPMAIATTMVVITATVFVAATVALTVTIVMVTRRAGHCVGRGGQASLALPGTVRDKVSASCARTAHFAVGSVVGGILATPIGAHEVASRFGGTIVLARRGGFLLFGRMGFHVAGKRDCGPRAFALIRIIRARYPFEVLNKILSGINNPGRRSRHAARREGLDISVAIGAHRSKGRGRDRQLEILDQVRSHWSFVKLVHSDQSSKAPCILLKRLAWLASTADGRVDHFILVEGGQEDLDEERFTNLPGEGSGGVIHSSFQPLTLVIIKDCLPKETGAEFLE